MDTLKLRAMLLGQDEIYSAESGLPTVFSRGSFSTVSKLNLYDSAAAATATRASRPSGRLPVADQVDTDGEHRRTDRQHRENVPDRQAGAEHPSTDDRPADRTYLSNRGCRPAPRWPGRTG